MSKISNLDLRNNQTSGISNPDQWLLDAVGAGSETTAGAYVNEETALRFANVLSCILLIAAVRATIKPQVYRKRKGGGKDYVDDHPLNQLFTKPNKETVGFSFLETETIHALTWGNAYSEISRNMVGEPLALFLQSPDGMRLYRESGGQIHMEDEYSYPGGRLVYEWTDANGKIRRRYRKNMLHIPNFSFNGIVGKSVIGQARETIGQGMAIQEYGSRFFSAGTHPSGVITHPDDLGDEEYNRLKLALTQNHSGLGKSHKLMILEGGAKFMPITLPADDAQFIESSGFNRQQICGLFRVPPHMIGDRENTTFNNVEHEESGFLKRCMIPWLNRCVEYYTCFLLSERERREKYIVMHDLTSLVHGDFKSMTDGYRTAVSAGWLSRNEVRERFDYNQIDGLDDTLVPVNMMRSSDLGRKDEI